MPSRRIAKGARTQRKKKLRLAKKKTISTTGVTSSHDKVKLMTKAVSKKSLMGDSAAASSPFSAVGKKGKKGVTEKKKKNKSVANMGTLYKRRSKLRKKQVAEKMALKEYIRDLESKKSRMSKKRNETNRMEKRELNKYMRQLKLEQEQKHKKELDEMEKEIQDAMATSTDGKYAKAHGHHQHGEWEDVTSEDEEEDEAVGEEDLVNMFAHLTA